jgi:hypothetical protein
MSMKQKDAVYASVKSVLKSKEIPWTENETVVKDLLYGQRLVRQQICEDIILGFKTGLITLKKEFDEAGLSDYTNGLVTNWLKKDPRLNGGIKPTTKVKVELEAGEPDQATSTLTDVEPVAPKTEDNLKFNDGWYVVGDGMLMAVKSRDEARAFIRDAKKKS